MLGVTKAETSAPPAVDDEEIAAGTLGPKRVHTAPWTNSPVGDAAPGSLRNKATGKRHHKAPPAEPDHLDGQSDAISDLKAHIVFLQGRLRCNTDQPTTQRMQSTADLRPPEAVPPGTKRIIAGLKQQNAQLRNTNIAMARAKGNGASHLFMEKFLRVDTQRTGVVAEPGMGSAIDVATERGKRHMRRIRAQAENAISAACNGDPSKMLQVMELFGIIAKNTRTRQGMASVTQEEYDLMESVMKSLRSAVDVLRGKAKTTWLEPARRAYQILAAAVGCEVHFHVCRLQNVPLVLFAIQITGSVAHSRLCVWRSPPPPLFFSLLVCLLCVTQIGRSIRPPTRD